MTQNNPTLLHVLNLSCPWIGKVGKACWRGRVHVAAARLEQGQTQVCRFSFVHAASVAYHGMRLGLGEDFLGRSLAHYHHQAWSHISDAHRHQAQAQCCWVPRYRQHRYRRRGDCTLSAYLFSIETDRTGSDRSAAGKKRKWAT
jgi:hypothetical protein